MPHSSVVEYYSSNLRFTGSSPGKGWHVFWDGKKNFWIKKVISSPARRPITTFRNRIVSSPLHHPLMCTFVGPTMYLTPDNQAQHTTVSGTEWVHGHIPKDRHNSIPSSGDWILSHELRNRTPAATLTGEIWTTNLCLINWILKALDQKGLRYLTLFYC